jgi:hypothetical protein
MNNFLIAPLLVFFSVSSTAAIAETEEPIFKECSYCQSFEQFQIAAKSEAKLNQTLNVHVMNLDKTMINRFKVTKKQSGYRVISYDNEPDGRGGRMRDRRVPYYSVTADSYGVEQKTQNSFYAFSSASIQLKESISTLEANVVPEKIAKSAWDLVGFSAVQNDVANHYSENTSATDDFNTYVSMAGKLSNKLNINKILMEVTFSDNSIAVLSLAYANDKRIQWDFERGADADGNIIKPSLDIKTPQTYRFTEGTETSFRSFFRAAGRAGVIFSGSTPSSGGGQVTCTPTNGSRYTCTYRF